MLKEDMVVKRAKQEKLVPVKQAILRVHTSYPKKKNAKRKCILVLHSKTMCCICQESITLQQISKDAKERSV